MNAVKVTIRYLDSKVVHSRYGYTRRLETVVRFVPEDQLDEVIEQFWSNHEVVEVKFTR